MKHAATCAMFSALMWVGGVAAPGAHAISVEPSAVKVEAPAGQRRGAVVTIHNRASDKPAHVKVYAQDLVIDADGEQEYRPAGSVERSCATWIRFVPSELDIPANESTQVRLSALAPEGATGSHFAVVFFEAQPTYTEEPLRVGFRIGVFVEVSIPDTEVRAATLTGFSFQQPKELLLEIHNEGNVVLMPEGNISIYDAGQQRVVKADLNSANTRILPGHRRRLSIMLPEPLAPGTYRAKATIDYGTKQLLVGELSAMTVK